MTILEEIMQMKSQGVRDEEIVNALQQREISPKEINDALNQAKIKSAVSDVSGVENTEEMQPSITTQGGLPPAPSQQPPLPGQQTTQGGYMPQTQEIPEQEIYTPQAEYPQSQDYYQEGYGEYLPTERFDTDTMIEIAEQVFAEKIKKIQKEVEDTTEFKTLAQTKINSISRRLGRIETIIDKLQIAILEKIGSYGKNLEGIKKEMSMMQESFRKMINPLAKRAEKKYSPQNMSTHKITAKKKKISKKK